MEAQPARRLEVDVVGHCEREGATWYELRCALEVAGAPGAGRREEWVLHQRLGPLRERLHDPVRQLMGEEGYRLRFGATPFARRGGLPGTTARLAAWCRALASAFSAELLPQAAATAALRALVPPLGLCGPRPPRAAVAPGGRGAAPEPRPGARAAPGASAGSTVHADSRLEPLADFVEGACKDTEAAGLRSILAADSSHAPVPVFRGGAPEEDADGGLRGRGCLTPATSSSTSRAPNPEEAGAAVAGATTSSVHPHAALRGVDAMGPSARQFVSNSACSTAASERCSAPPVTDSAVSGSFGFAHKAAQPVLRFSSDVSVVSTEGVEFMTPNGQPLFGHSLDESARNIPELEFKTPCGSQVLGPERATPRFSTADEVSVPDSSNSAERHDQSTLTVSRDPLVLAGGGGQGVLEAPPAFCPFQSFVRAALGPGDESPPCSWSAGDADQFHVRDSGYAETRRKVPSAFSLYEVAGADAVTSTRKISGIVDKLPARSGLPPSPPSAPAWSAEWGVPRVLVVHAQLPHRSGTPWSHHPADDAGFSLVSYHVLSTEASHLLAVGRETPALRLWRRFVEAGESTRDLTFKAVGIVENLDTMRVPGIVEKFNAKPVAITKSARVLAQSLPEVLEIEFDVRQWAFLARHSFVSLRSLATKAVIQVGYLVEGKSDAELPEQILAHIRLHHADFTQAKSIPDL